MDPVNQDHEGIPTVAVRTSHWPSPVWLIPIIALLIGAWLLFQAWYERGPKIVVQFQSAEGIEIGKTDVRYKAVSVGKVRALRLSDDLKSIEAEVELSREIGKHLGNDARFWIVKPQINRTGITGLSTLLSGAYIGMDPGTNNDDQRFYQGDERPPVITPSENGRRFYLIADSLGSMDIGAPVFYKQLAVGEVIDYKILANQGQVRLEIFVRDPYFEFVRNNARFWNASGAEVKMSAAGAEFRMESLTSLLIGGIAFDVPKSMTKEEVSQEGREFILYKSYGTAQEKQYNQRLNYVMYFDSTVRGLAVGSSVDYMGMPVGRVEDIDIAMNSKNLDIRIPVLISLQPQQFDPNILPEKAEALMAQLVKKGLRAKLETSSFLTGQKLITLSMNSKAESASIKTSEPYAVFPTLSGDSSDLTRMAGNVMASLQETLDGVKRIVNSGKIDKSIDNLNAVLAETEQAIKAAKLTLQSVDQKTLPAVQRDVDRITDELSLTLQKIQQSMGQVDRLTAPNSPTQYQLQEMLEEVTAASRSVRSLTETLQRQPTSLIRGKKGD